MRKMIHFFAIVIFAVFVQEVIFVVESSSFSLRIMFFERNIFLSGVINYK